uniref:carboxypeptidase N subunit 2-like n=1 Tax=Euleptes europaea TaxID=460621 RepID=UPI0025403699|nr:carboxypeptidase N subunit 2-like [Euleptes europaea]
MFHAAWKDLGGPFHNPSPRGSSPGPSSLRGTGANGAALGYTPLLSREASALSPPRPHWGCQPLPGMIVENGGCYYLSPAGATRLPTDPGSWLDRWRASGPLRCLCLLAAALLSDPAWTCPAPCQCFGNTTVFCTEDVPEGIPPNATRLVFAETSLQSLRSRAFGNSSALTMLLLLKNPLLCSVEEAAFEGLPNLRELAISGSNLSTLARESLAGLAHLRQLSVKFSPLATLEGGLFNSTPALKSLHLEGNQLELLPPNIFHPLKELETLHLAQNLLAGLPEEAFEPLALLQVLRLSDNRLSRLLPETFSPLVELRELFLDGNGLTELPGGLFSRLSRLKRLCLRYNGLRLLCPTAFSLLSGLATLDLDNNRLADLPEGLFEGTPNLTRLSVAHNHLRSIPDGLLAPLSRLSSLVLSHNLLGNLSAGAFQGLSTLTQLHLDHNHLRALPRDAFANLTSLTALDLASNRLASLPEGIFDGNAHLYSVALEGNPWACDCHLAGLVSWLREDRWRLKADAFCRRPDYLEQVSLQAVREELLVCLPDPEAAHCRAQAQGASGAPWSGCLYLDAAGAIQLTCSADRCHQLSLCLPREERLRASRPLNFSGEWALDSQCGARRVRIMVTIQEEEPP